MAEYGRIPRKREAQRYHDQDLGDKALAFAAWFVRSKFHLMESFLGELDKDPVKRDRAELRRRYLEAVYHAQRVLLARGVVTVLLAFGAVASFATAFLGFLNYAPAALRLDPASVRTLFGSLAAVASSATLLLLLLRLALDRYLDLIDTTVTFVGMQLAATRGR